MFKLFLSLSVIAPAAAFLSTSHTFGSLTQVIFIQLTPKNFVLILRSQRPKMISLFSQASSIQWLAFGATPQPPPSPTPCPPGPPRLPVNPVAIAGTRVDDDVSPIRQTQYASSWRRRIAFRDPLGCLNLDFWQLGTEGTIGYLRHAEIKHGRVAMAGFLGYLVQSTDFVSGPQ